MGVYEEEEGGEEESAHSQTTEAGLKDRSRESMACSRGGRGEGKVSVDAVTTPRTSPASAATARGGEGKECAAAGRTRREAVTRWTEDRALGGQRGTRVGEARVPGPYTEGGASGSGASWGRAGQGKWLRKDGHQGQGCPKGSESGESDLEASLKEQKEEKGGEGTNVKRRRREGKKKGGKPSRRCHRRWGHRQRRLAE